MPPSLSKDAVAAVEDALLRGEWTQALNDSRRILAGRLVQHREQTMTPEEERVLSVYLQTVFELDLDDEVETAATIARAFTPLPSGIAIQWGKFLIVMNRRPMALQTLQDLLQSFTDGGETFTTGQYAEAVEVLTLQLLLPDQGIETARTFVTGDTVLDDAVKLQLLRRIQAAHLAAQEVKNEEVQTAVTQRPSDRSNGVAGDGELSRVSYPSMSGGLAEAGNSSAGQDDDSSSYVMIGGTAIALAVAAAGALRYREKIQDCVSSAIPVISKGLADAKYALFEA